MTLVFMTSLLRLTILIRKACSTFMKIPIPTVSWGNIHAAVDDKLVQVQTAMEKELKTMYMSDVLVDLEKAIEEKVKRT